MKFNTAGQRFHVIAFDDAGRVTGDAANITCELAIDGGARAALTDVNPVEIGTTGEYVFDLEAAETNGHALSFTPASSSGAQVLGVPANVVYTTLEVAIKAKTDLITTSTVYVSQTISSNGIVENPISLLGERHSRTIATVADYSASTLVIGWRYDGVEIATVLDADITKASDSLTFSLPDFGEIESEMDAKRMFWSIRIDGTKEAIMYGNWTMYETSLPE